MSHHHFAFSATEWCLLQWIETFAFHHQLLPFFMTKWITSGPHQMVPTSLLVRCRDSSNSSLDSLSNNHSTQMVLNVMSHLICIIIHKLIPVLIQLLSLSQSADTSAVCVPGRIFQLAILDSPELWLILDQKFKQSDPISSGSAGQTMTRNSSNSNLLNSHHRETLSVTRL